MVGRVQLAAAENVEQKSYQPHEKGAIRKTLRGLWATLKDIFGHKSIFVFMLAYFFYIDGVGTIIHMSTPTAPSWVWATPR